MILIRHFWQLSFLLVCMNNGVHAQVRQKISLNSGWEFVLNDQQGLSSLQTKAWQKINLPHTWNALDILDDTVGYHQGIGWYKKLVQVPQNFSDKHVESFFEA